MMLGGGVKTEWHICAGGKKHCAEGKVENNSRKTGAVQILE